MKPKVLYISSVIPDTSCGARIAIYRHFVEKEDFDVAIAAYEVDSPHILRKFEIRRSKLAFRLMKTRFARLYYNFEYFINWKYIPSGLYHFARNFNPDVIMTVPDNFHAGIALNLANKLRKPLISDFQDLFPLSQFFPRYCEPYPFIRRLLMTKYCTLNNQSDISLYTSEGMMEYFGNPSNGQVLYPIGDHNRPKLDGSDNEVKNDGQFTIVYAGNCYGSYGRMLLQIAREVMKQTSFHLKIFPVGQGWTDEEINEMTEAGIYQTFLPFDELKKEFSKANAFLTVMSFEEEDRSFVQTSFTTKWLDYAPYGKPIFVWAPDYSSASSFAAKYKCGIVTSDNNVEAFMSKLRNVVNDEYSLKTYGKAAREVSDTILNPVNVHKVLVESVRKSMRGQA